MKYKQQKEKANELRKANQFNEALSIYEELWRENGDLYDAAGFLNCLRNLNNYERAIPIADELFGKCKSLRWCKNEVVWTYIKGKLENNIEKLSELLFYAKKIIELEPEFIALRTTIFDVLQFAKQHKKWEIVDEWVQKIDPEELSDEVLLNESGKRISSYKSRWYQSRIRALIETGSPNEAIQILSQVKEKFPAETKFFLRLEALAFFKNNELEKSEQIYKTLTSSVRPDWWILQEYARVLKDLGHKEEALKKMYLAANSTFKLELIVTLLLDIGLMLKELSRYGEAKAHFYLCKHIREKNGWSVPDELMKQISELGAPYDFETALKICKAEWKKSSGISAVNVEQKKLKGRVNLGPEIRFFCFIIGDDKEGYFCKKSDLPQDIQDGEQVLFTAIKSFDRKKNKEGWKAIRITRC